MDNLMLTETIDRYLAGQMSDKERQAFQEKLEEDKELRREVELQREVISAIRKQALRNKVNTFEQNRKKRTVVKWAAYVLVPLAVAACMAACIVLPQVDRVKQIGADVSLYAAATDEISIAYASLKGQSQVSDIILSANHFMKQQQYAKADELLLKGLEQVATITKDDVQLWYAKEDMLYMRALCAIKQHSVYRTRYLLWQVIQMNATHKDAAEQLLKQIKEGK
jgi:hypothetical protein